MQVGDGTILLPPRGLSPNPVSSGNPAEPEPGQLAPATGNAGQCWAAQATPCACSQVDDLKAKLAIQEIELKQKNENADKLIHVVGVETEKVSKEKAIADEEEVKVEVINKVGDRHGFRRATDGPNQPDSLGGQASQAQGPRVRRGLSFREMHPGSHMPQSPIPGCGSSVSGS